MLEVKYLEKVGRFHGDETQWVSDSPRNISGFFIWTKHSFVLLFHYLADAFDKAEVFILL